MQEKQEKQVIDYSIFMKEMLINLEKNLEYMRIYWETEADYIEANKEKKILNDLVDDLNWLINNDNISDDNISDNDLYLKRSTKFFTSLDKHHRKLWV